jgi:hypothetical protein
MTSPASAPNRTFICTRNDSGCLVHWVDTWYCRFDRRWLSATSRTFPLPGLLGLPELTSYFQTTFDSTGRVVSRVEATVDLWSQGSVTFGPAGRSMISGSATWTHTDAVQSSTKVGPDGKPHLVLGNTKGDQVVVSAGGLYDVALGAPVQGVAVAVLQGDAAGGGGVTSQPGVAGPPGVAVIPGDFRRPSWARTTQALADDELWAVNQLALSHGVTGPEMMAILLELTGARRVAYHPDGFYGISNLSAAMLNHWLSVDQFAPALNGQLGGIGSVEEFLAASVHRQLVVTDACLRANLGGQSGVIPVFLLLATGAVAAQAGPTTPLPPRLQPPSSNGSLLTGADIAARIAARAALINDEFVTRLPVTCAPPLGATRLMPSQALYAGQAIPSPNGQFGLTYQDDGNLVLYGTGGAAVWASNTAGSSTGYAVMQGDGNLVIYDLSSRAVWASHTDTHPGAWLAVDNGGFVTVISPDGGTQLWRS